jgi:catechol 2,3-dioxygenase-like lactoylglutathione lyase family enzyme
MYDHIGLKVADLDASVRFYQATLAPLGHVLGPRDQASAGFGPAGEPALWLHGDEDAPGGGVHVAFRAATRSAVRHFHTAGLAAGGRDNGPAGVRPDYGANYFAAFLFDPDGNNIEAVCLADAE